MDGDARERGINGQDLQSPDYRLEPVLIPPGYVDHVWDAVAPGIADALKRSAGEYSLDDVREAIKADLWQLWTDGASIACTSIQQFPSKRMLYVHLGAGEREAVPRFWPRIQEFALRERCSAVRFFGRPGWRRSHVLPDGWRHTHDVVTVELAQ